MTRYERRIYQLGVAVGAVLIIAMFSVLTEECGAKIDAYAAPAMQLEDFTEETTETPENGKIQRQSAMPCDNPEAFRKWLAAYEEETDEPETSEEAPAETTGESGMDGDAPNQADAADPESARSNTSAEEMESEAPGSIYYRIAGDTIPEEIQLALYEALQAEQIEFWFTGALATIYQESRGNVWAQNPNGLDKGLLQYRTTYWPATAAANGEAGADIFDWQAQVRVYARQTARRINAGLSTDEVISRHKTSDDCPALDWTYIQQVRQWLSKMEAAQ